MTGGKVIPEPLINRPRVLIHLMDVVEAVSVCESRGHQFSAKTPLTEIAAYYSTFSSFDGGSRDFLTLFRHVEDMRATERAKRNGNK